MFQNRSSRLDYLQRNGRKRLIKLALLETDANKGGWEPDGNANNLGKRRAMVALFTRDVEFRESMPNDAWNGAGRRVARDPVHLRKMVLA